SKSSAFLPPGNDQSNLCNKQANVISIDAVAKLIPGQPLLPAPNGISSKSCPLKSIELFKNLSGLNSSGSSQFFGSLPIAHAFINTLVFAATSYPCTVTSRVDSRGTKIGIGGCSLKDSFITAFK
ncbi:hypothetical protein LINPERHAP1_LOCUS37935, partial [Linum perenne]